MAPPQKHPHKHNTEAHVGQTALNNTQKILFYNSAHNFSMATSKMCNPLKIPTLEHQENKRSKFHFRFSSHLKPKLKIIRRCNTVAVTAVRAAAVNNQLKFSNLKLFIELITRKSFVLFSFYSIVCTPFPKPPPTIACVYLCVGLSIFVTWIFMQWDEIKLANLNSF